MTKLYSALLAGLIIVASSNAAKSEEYFDVVRDARSNVVKNTFNNCVLTKWMSNTDKCGGKVAQAVTYDLKEKEARTVYFEFNKSRIAPSEFDKLDSLAYALKADTKLQRVQIVGFADRMGSAQYNEALSKKRAKAVEERLRKQGYLNTTVAETKWLGESAPVTSCAENLPRAEKIACLQKDRRVEVELDYTVKQ